MNRATRLFVIVYGVIFGISGISHGIFEALHGNIPTNGFFVSAIGEAQRMWPHGNEFALTLFPNFLFAGIITILTGLTLIIWSIAFVQKRNGPTIFLILFVILLLVGGGVAQILFFPIIWLVSTQINNPLAWWRNKLSKTTRKRISKLWGISLIIGSMLLLSALLIAITGIVPLVNDSEEVLSIMMISLCAVVMLIPITIISGFASDLQRTDGTIKE
jgi:hypothetical protein